MPNGTPIRNKAFSGGHTVNYVVQVRAKFGDVSFDTERSLHASDNIGPTVRREYRACAGNLLDHQGLCGAFAASYG
jgi:hypothetical protein